MIADLNTYLTKAIPDTKLTIEKYADAKFEYLVRFRYRLEQGQLLNSFVDGVFVGSLAAAFNIPKSTWTRKRKILDEF